MMHVLARQVLRLLGAALATALALAVASALSVGRPSSGVEPLEAALIALAITLGRDLVDALADVLIARAERRTVGAALKGFLAKLTPDSDVREHVPYDIIHSLRGSACFRLKLPEDKFASALAAVEQSIVSIRGYAVYWADVSPSDRRKLSDSLGNFISVTGI